MKNDDKVFDYISLHYLYHRHEKHEVIPGADDMAKFKATDENTKSQSVDVGASGNPLAGGVTPTATVHVGRENKLTYERESNSWRKGLSFESCERSLMFSRCMLTKIRCTISYWRARLAWYWPHSRYLSASPLPSTLRA